MYQPRYIPPVRNAWQELGTQAFGFGQHIMDGKVRREELERRAMLDERDETRYAGEQARLERQEAAAKEKEMFDLQRQGFTPVNKNDDALRTIGEMSGNIRSSTSPVPRQMNGGEPIVGMGEAMRSLAPKFDYQGGQLRYERGNNIAAQENDLQHTRSLSADARNFGQQKELTQFQENLVRGRPQRASFSATPGGILNSSTGAISPYPEGTGPEAKPRDPAVLRKEFESNPTFKQSNDVAQSWQRILQSSRNPSAAGDMSVIFNYMKMLDPGSTVREGEFASAQNSAGWSARARAQYNSAINGQRLADEQRADFVERAQMLAEGQQEMLQGVIDRYSGFAEQAGVDPSSVIYDPFSIPAAGAKSQQPEALLPSNPWRR